LVLFGGVGLGQKHSRNTAKAQQKKQQHQGRRINDHKQRKRRGNGTEEVAKEKRQAAGGGEVVTWLLIGKQKKTQAEKDGLEHLETQTTTSSSCLSSRDGEIEYGSRQ
jgi:hypothetical protein